MTTNVRTLVVVLIGFALSFFQVTSVQARCPDGGASPRDTLDFSFIRDLGYEATLLGETVVEGQPCWRVQLSEPTRTDTVMKTMVLLVRKRDHLPIRMDFYDKEGLVAKSLILSAVDLQDGSPVAMRMTVKDHVSATEVDLNLSVTYRYGSPSTTP